MTPGLRVIEPGTHTTLQDSGRFGMQALGVPVSGALDPVSFRIANGLVGNPLNAGALEVYFNGPVLEVCADNVRVALAGTEGEIELTGDESATIPAWRSVLLRRGARFRVGRVSDSACCYLAVAGGFQVDPCLGSVSTFARAGLGGFHGRALQPDDHLPTNLNRAPDRGEVRLRNPPAWSRPATLRVVLGPQEAYFTPDAVKALVEETFTVSVNSDRMGMRLDGIRLSHRDSYNIVSDGIPTGAIQVPGSGQPILLLNDHQTTGGYPKIATVISADLPAAGRLRPGDEVHFASVSVADAEDACREQQEKIDAMLDALEPVSGGGMNLAALYGENLISGIVRGDE
ncbi:MAG: biotin-dependent carboxyltransferase family protein [Gammaproteobacteria bacterium]|nr:biotin-dependent carboxyltransferase family protein [Gammaproteobacteria bacterium]